MVGQTMEIAYTLRGALPAGDYHLSVHGYQQSMDAQLHADILYRQRNGDQQAIASTDGAPPGDGGVAAGSIDAVLPGAAMPATCGDSVVLRIRLIAGATGYTELATSLAIP